MCLVSNLHTVSRTVDAWGWEVSVRWSGNSRLEGDDKDEESQAKQPGMASSHSPGPKPPSGGQGYSGCSSTHAVNGSRFNRSPLHRPGDANPRHRGSTVARQRAGQAACRQPALAVV